MANDEWITPPDLTEAVRLFFGGVIELDPASCQAGQRVVRAKEWCGRDHKEKDHRDGLCLNYTDYGTVWLNPPYSQPAMGQFVEKALDECKCCLLLSNASLDTVWAHNLLREAVAVMFTRGRLGFMTTKIQVDATDVKESQIVVECAPGVVTLRIGKARKRFKHTDITSESKVVTALKDDVLTVTFPTLMPVDGNRVGQALWYIANPDMVRMSQEFSESIDRFIKLFEPWGSCVELGHLCLPVSTKPKVTKKK
jgi:hypothetical protein